ncbi:MAG: DegV family protein [Christensenellaceae bacterium]|jgi:DegV family protein with EDD domain|nr:DegV family protein [Christensenellaceae bacterium]
MTKIKITTDSVADLPKDMQTDLDIAVFPLVINLDEPKEDYDGMPNEIYEFVAKTGKTPKTAARSPEEYLEFFNKHKPEGGSLIHFTISSQLSASYNNALEASKMTENVFVVDSLSLSTGVSLQILYAHDLIKEGKPAKEVFDAVTSRRGQVQASFVVKSLEFLYKGGRCSGISRFMSIMLGIKPELVLSEDGLITPGRKYMGMFEAVVPQYVSNMLKNKKPDTSHIFITHTEIDEKIVDNIEKQILAAYPKAVIHKSVAGGTITSHCGKGTIGILYYTE